MIRIAHGQMGRRSAVCPLLAEAPGRAPEAVGVVGDRGYDNWDIGVRVRVADSDMAADLPSNQNAVEKWPICPTAARYDTLGGTFLATIKRPIAFVRA